MQARLVKWSGVRAGWPEVWAAPCFRGAVELCVLTHLIGRHYFVGDGNVVMVVGCVYSTAVW